MVGGAGALAADHGGAQGIHGVARVAEGRALVGFLQPLQDLPADADGRFLGADVLHLEMAFGIKGRVGLGQAEAAVGRLKGLIGIENSFFATDVYATVNIFK